MGSGEEGARLATRLTKKERGRERENVCVSEREQKVKRSQFLKKVNSMISLRSRMPGTIELIYDITVASRLVKRYTGHGGGGEAWKLKYEKQSWPAGLGWMTCHHNNNNNNTTVK